VLVETAEKWKPPKKPKKEGSIIELELSRRLTHGWNANENLRKHSFFLTVIAQLNMSGCLSMN